jgi:Zinc carboxypeptidase
MNFRVYHLFFVLITLSLPAQELRLDYYLPNMAYDPIVPTPLQYLGFEVGEKHVSHDQLLAYMKALDLASDRISLAPYGRSHEGRELVCLTITSSQNHSKIEQIKRERRDLCDPNKKKPGNLSKLPAVTYMGYSIHGNEASGSNAALAVAYYLAAGESAELSALLENSIILLDPCFNPDGLQRFSAWVNSRSCQSIVSDPASDQYNEPWPRGRTNHYWFDLNRDWLVAQQPESIGRVAVFQDWHPNILTDHHEMGSNSTFFFQPGVPSRVNPITPKRNQELCAKIATFHADILSKNKVLFYSGENFDDFYYGKGSTYPDAQGCIGILFEQASSRGTAQDTENGLLSFPYTVRNQVLTSFSTLQATLKMRVELNEYLHDFYKNALEEAEKDPIKGYVFSNADRNFNGREFLSLLLKHNIKVTNLKREERINGLIFPANNAFFVSCAQAQYRLIKGIFSQPTSFQDSVFYDISAWTLADAFGLDWSSTNTELADPDAGLSLTSRYVPAFFAEAPYAYIIRPEAHELPKILGQLLKKGLLVKVATKAFTCEGGEYPAGSLLLPSAPQPLAPDSLMELMNNLQSTIPISGVSNGLTSNGPDLGSDNFRTVRLPKILLLTGDGVRPEDAGEIWHLFDIRYQMPVTHLNLSRLSNTTLSKYNVLLLADASPSSSSVEKIKEFVRGGGTLIATGASLRWLKSVELIDLDLREESSMTSSARLPYDGMENDQAAKRMPGAIFEGLLDLGHPICYGYSNRKLPLFLGDALYIEPVKNPYATPVQFSETPLRAGYVHPRQKKLLPSAAAVTVHSTGKGRIIGFAINPNFRGFWLGTNRLFANAVFFGDLIGMDATARKP